MSSGHPASPVRSVPPRKRARFLTPCSALKNCSEDCMSVSVPVSVVGSFVRIGAMAVCPARRWFQRDLMTRLFLILNSVVALLTAEYIAYGSGARLRAFSLILRERAIHERGDLAMGEGGEAGGMGRAQGAFVD